MATQILVKRTSNALVPVNQYDWELFSEIPLDRHMAAKLTMPNSIKLHRFYWGLLGKVVANHPWYRTSKALHLYIKTRLGYVNEIAFHDGEIIMNVDSTAFDKMDGIARIAFVKGAVDLIIHDVLPGVERGPLLEQIEIMVGIRYADVTRDDRNDIDG